MSRTATTSMSLNKKLSSSPSYQDIKSNGTQLQQVVSAQLPTRYGDFIIHGFYDPQSGKEHSALVRGDVHNATDCPVRVHSECHTGDTLGSLRCDCQQQLTAALRYLGRRPYGAVIYLRQEGRGIGLINKLKAYHLQDRGLDTVEANEYLGFHADQRTFRVGADIIKMLGIRSIRLISNNPLKFEELRSDGIKITGRIKLRIKKNRHNKKYLITKKEKMRHLE